MSYNNVGSLGTVKFTLMGCRTFDLTIILLVYNNGLVLWFGCYDIYKLTPGTNFLNIMRMRKIHKRQAEKSHGNLFTY